MKMLTLAILGLLSLLPLSANTLVVRVDTNWFQPYVMAGNQTETLARIILDGKGLTNDVWISDLPLVLNLENASGAISNCILHGRFYWNTGTGTSDGPTQSYPLDPPSGTKTTNVFHFPNQAYVPRGGTSVLELTGAVFRNATNAILSWGTTPYVGSWCLITESNILQSNGLIRVVQITNCTTWTNAYAFGSNGAPTIVETETSSGMKIPTTRQGGAKLTVTIDPGSGINHWSGQIIGKGRPFRHYDIDKTYDFVDWYGMGYILGGNKADSNGVFRVPFTHADGRPAREFFRNRELPEDEVYFP